MRSHALNPDISPSELRALFAEPPVEFRPAPFWSWNDKLDAAELCRQIDLMKQAGLGGFFMHSREGLRTEYMSQEWLDLVRICVEHAANVGIKAWLYDEDKWPSGFAGGRLVRDNPDTRHRFLLRFPTGSRDVPQGPDARLLGERDGWQYHEVPGPSGIDWFNGTSYTDVSDPAVTDAYLSSTHEVYRQIVGGHFGQVIPGVFTDEPCWAHVDFGPHGALAWTRHFPGKFRELKGYDLLDHLPSLFEQREDYRAVRFDYRDVLTRLFRDGFTRRYAGWCDANQLVLTGHFMREDGLADQAAWIGSAMAHLVHMHWPGVDHLGRQTLLHFTQKQVASAASQAGCERVLCETFGASGQGLSLEDQKWIIDYHLAMGINFINPHLAPYSMRGARKRDYPPALFFQQPWWKAYRQLNDYTARLSMMLARGRRIVHLLVLSPLSTAWAEYAPGEDNLALRTIESEFQTLIQSLLDAQLDFELGDETVIEGLGSVSGDGLQIGLQSYKAVLIPRGTVWREGTLRLLDEFHNAGGAVFRVSDEPCHIAGTALHRHLEFPIIDLEANAWAETLRPHTQPDAVVYTSGSSRPDRRFRLHFRQDQGRLILFVANNHQHEAVDAEVRLRGQHHLEVWDPQRGSVLPCGAHYDPDGDCTIIRKHFSPIESLLVVSTNRDSRQVQCPAPPPRTFRKEQILAGPWTIIASDPNALLLDFCDLVVDGRTHERISVYRVVETLLQTAGPGVPFSMRFRFQSELHAPSSLRLLCETPGRFSITLNGRQVPGEAFDQSWRDPSFRTADIASFIQPGGNDLIISGVYTADPEPLEIECPAIVGAFLANVQGNILRPLDSTMKAGNLPAEGWPFFAGGLTLEQSFGLPAGPTDRLYVEFQDLRATALRLWINGAEIDPILWQPWRRDVTEHLGAGRNTIRVELVTSLFNLLGPHHSECGEQMWVGPWMWAERTGWTDDHTFIPYGFSGACIVAESDSC